MSIFKSEDATTFKNERLVRALDTHLPDTCMSDAYVLAKLRAAESYVAGRLKVFLEPTVVFPYEPSEEEVTALDGKPYAEEPGYDYDSGFFKDDRWGYIIAWSRPIISVEWARMAYPNPKATFFTFPNDWLRIDKKSGQIRLVPASAAFNAPLNAFMMQAMGGGGTIPFAIQLKYTAGIKNVREDWPDLLDVIYRVAILNIVNEEIKPQSASISADGLSQSMSFDAQKHAELIEEYLFGPKGSNGGLWSRIHGIGVTIGGSLV